MVTPTNLVTPLSRVLPVKLRDHPSATQEIPRISWNQEVHTAFTSTRITDTPEPKRLVYQIYSFVFALRHKEHNFFVHCIIKKFAGSPQY
jgi:imidazoleglycerol phosphate synthase glutamine amidotransferase subunit HisH